MLTRTPNNELSQRALASLYEKPLPSTRTGPLYNAFSYPTKISPEAIAVFIATHTKPGDVVLDAFAGSGTTGLAALLCDRPTDAMKEMALELGIEPNWGPRTAHLFEIGNLGSFVARTLCSPPDPEQFAHAVASLIAQAQKAVGWFYRAKDPDGMEGALRHVIWSDVLACPQCGKETSYWDAAVCREPLKMVDSFICTGCSANQLIEDCERACEEVEDEFGLGKVVRKRRIPAQIFGQTGSKKWQRKPTADDLDLLESMNATPLPPLAPNKELVWGDLYRAGYHKGISRLHHFYTRRNFVVLATMWELAGTFPEDLRDALRLLVLSYNSSHSTLMTRIVLKKGQGDFVLTGAQSGVLYISGLPVEKNIIEGVARKAKPFKDAFALLRGSRSEVQVHHTSSEAMSLPGSSVDYVFTDPPFGDYIPYAELNQINELWLGSTTDRSKEIIVSQAQKKGVDDYGRMMGNVFLEMARVLKPDGMATVVFHSAHSAIWRALASAYSGAGFSVKATSVLDKIQASFKQVVSGVSVKGDPLLLLAKDTQAQVHVEADSVITEVLSAARVDGSQNKDPQRLWSLFVGRCLELGINVPMEAKEFYSRARQALGET